MKKTIATTTICVLCTSTLAFASDLKIFKKGNTEYVPLNKVIQKSGGKIQNTKDGIDVNVDGKNVIIDKNSSFAKIGKDYYPLNQKKLDGFNIPVDTKPLYEDDEVYIAKGFLKDNNLVDYTISKDKIIIKSQEKEISNNNNNKQNEDEKKEPVNNQTTNNTEQENNTQRPTRPVPPTPSIPNRPSTGNNNNNNGNNSNNNSGNSNPNNGNDSTTDNDNNQENNGNENGNAGSGNGNDNDTNTDNTGGSTGGNTDSNPVEPNNPAPIDNQNEQ